MANKPTVTFEDDGEPLRCRAKSKQHGGRCKKTKVPGRTVCRYHGGNAGRPIVHGRRSKALGRFREAYNEARDDPGLMDLRDTMALLDIVVQRALKRAEAILLDQQGEDEDQLILFSMDPDLDPEVQKIIDEPEI